MVDLLHELIFQSADRFADKEALVHNRNRISFDALAGSVQSFAATMLALGLDRDERVAVYLEKRPETVSALFGASAAGGVFVPVNPLLKPEVLIISSRLPIKYRKPSSSMRTVSPDHTASSGMGKPDEEGRGLKRSAVFS